MKLFHWFIITLIFGIFFTILNNTIPVEAENYDNDAYILRQLEDVNDNLKDIKELLGRLNDCCRNNGR